MDGNQPDSLSQFTKAFAVIIGIGRYKDPEIPVLKYTRADAKDLYEVLIDPKRVGIQKERIRLLLDENATLQNIKSAIGTWLWRQAGQDSTVIIFFSGHGGVEPDASGSQVKYLLPWDTLRNDLYATAISTYDFKVLLQRIESKRLAIFLDACHSGGMIAREGIRDIATIGNVCADLFSGSGRAVITASQGNQLSFEDDQLGHGIFAYHLLEAIKGQADENNDGKISLTEAFNYLAREVPRTAHKLAGAIQEPMMQSELTSDIVLAVNLEKINYIQNAKAREEEEHRIQEDKKKLFQWWSEHKLNTSHYDRALRVYEADEALLNASDKIIKELTLDLLAGRMTVKNYVFSVDQIVIPPGKSTPPPTIPPKSPSTGRDTKPDHNSAILKSLLIGSGAIIVIILIMGFVFRWWGTTAPAIPGKASISEISNTPAASDNLQPITSPSPTAPVEASPVAGGGGTLRWASAQTPLNNIGWPLESTSASAFSMQMGLQTLITLYSDGTIAPVLAESCDISNTGSENYILFYLRKNIQFHDGTECKAAAVAWNLEQVKSTPEYKYYTQYWKSIDVLDDYTVAVYLTRWQNTLLNFLSSPPCDIVSPTAYQKYGIDGMKTQMAGTGPFIQKEVGADHLTLVKNNGYWEPGKPYLDEIQILYMPDETSRVAALKSGKADVINCNMNPALVTQLESAGFQVVSQQSGVSFLIGDSLNDESPWSNILIRLAAEYAIDKDFLTNTFGDGYWGPAYQFNSSDSMAFNPNQGENKYNPAKAKMLMAEAGYPNGFATTLAALDSDNKALVQTIAADLHDIGIEAPIKYLNTSDFARYNSSSQNFISFYNLPVSYNPNQLFDAILGSGSLFTQVSKPENWDALLTAALATAWPEKSTTVNCETALSKYQTAIPLFYTADFVAMSEKVQDLDPRISTGISGSVWSWDLLNAHLKP